MNLIEKEIEEFNYFYNKACMKMEGLIILDNYKASRLNFFQKIRANKAINYFEQALAIVPDHFQSLFLLGKIFERLEEYEKALLNFEKAMMIELTNHNIPEAASLVAMQLNQIDKAIEYSKEALLRNPNEPTLMGNHAMNLLIAGLDSDAIETIDKALVVNSKDEINIRIKEKILAVIECKIKRPNFKDILG